jgi:hypothetical protein
VSNSIVCFADNQVDAQRRIPSQNVYDDPDRMLTPGMEAACNPAGPVSPVSTAAHRRQDEAGLEQHMAHLSMKGEAALTHGWHTGDIYKIVSISTIFSCDISLETKTFSIELGLYPR